MARWQPPDGGSIYFEHHRGEKRPLVLIHGWGTNCRVWDTVAKDLLAQGHEILAFDQRGCGQSDKDFATASIDDLVSDTLGLIAETGAANPVLNGWSLGGAIAVGAAGELGEGCAGVVLTCGASPRYTQADGFPHGGTSQDVHDTVAAMRADRISFFHGLSRAVCAKPVGEPVEDWLWHVFCGTAPVADQSLAGLAGLDQRETLAKLETPLLSIIGTEDGFTPPGIGEAAAEMAPDGELVRFEGCGHAPFLEDFEGYMDVLAKFLAGLKGDLS